ncbi:hypothetical protein, partial [Geobacillus proteiniphilus]|uniref:hypothetical protein n=1 Tax=Geobacillus proteiniphilus TaxID=860353 RepID=UPI00195D6BB2
KVDQLFSFGSPPLKVKSPSPSGCEHPSRRRTFALRDRQDGDISPSPAGRGLPLGEITAPPLFVCASFRSVFKERGCCLDLLPCNLASRNPTPLDSLKRKFVFRFLKRPLHHSIFIVRCQQPFIHTAPQHFPAAAAI